MSTDSPIHFCAFMGETPGATTKGDTAGFAAMALAHSRAYGAALRDTDYGRNDGASEHIRDALAGHLYSMIAAFTAAALMEGWSPKEIDVAVEEAAPVDEWALQWLSDAGYRPDQIDRLTTDLNAPGVWERIPGETTEEA